MLAAVEVGGGCTVSVPGHGAHLYHHHVEGVENQDLILVLLKYKTIRKRNTTRSFRVSLPLARVCHPSVCQKLAWIATQMGV